MEIRSIKGRDATFDMMKGIAILAMLCGHCVIPSVLHKFIYMWHMPLFFLVSGYFYHVKPWRQLLYSSYRGLLLPYTVTCGFILLACLFLDSESLTTHLLGFVGLPSSLLFLSGSVSYGNCGPLWFLPALFWCRLIYNGIWRLLSPHHPFLMGGIILMLSTLSVKIGTKCFIPFYLAQGMAGLIFYYIGCEVKEHSVLRKATHAITYLALILVVVIGMLIGEVYFYALYFPCWILNVLVAVSATGLIYMLCRHEAGRKAFAYLAQIGRISLLILCVHGIDGILSISKTFVFNVLRLEGRISYFSFDLMLFAFSLIGTAIVIRSKYVRKIYNIK